LENASKKHKHLGLPGAIRLGANEIEGEMLAVGDKFPAFTLPDQNGDKKTLKSLPGKYKAIYFYPKDNTSGCSLEARGFSALAEKFKEKDSSVTGVSPDGQASHEKFCQKQDLTITLLSDTEHVLMEKAGVWQKKKMYGKEFMGVVRTTFLVDPKGKVAFVWTKVKPLGHAEEVLKKLIELQGEEK
jgi:peroxiredoxin Q/BCP